MFTRISPEYLHGETAMAELFLIDQYDREHCSELEVRVDRTATMRPFVRRPEREGLFVRAETKSAPKLAPGNSQEIEKEAGSSKGEFNPGAFYDLARKFGVSWEQLWAALTQTPVVLDSE
jgi:hypothetical protein